MWKDYLLSCMFKVIANLYYTIKLTISSIKPPLKMKTVVQGLCKDTKNTKKRYYSM